MRQAIYTIEAQSTRTLERVNIKTFTLPMNSEVITIVNAFCRTLENALNDEAIITFDYRDSKTMEYCPSVHN